MRKMTFLPMLFGAALAASLTPISARAAAGDLYVADGSDGIIFKFTPAGIRSTFASGLYQPSAMAFDRQGNLFVADSGSCVSGDGSDCTRPSLIYRFTPAGARSTFASLASPQLLGMAFDGSGNLFVSAADSASLRFTPDGVQSTFASKDSIWGLAFDRSGNLYAVASTSKMVIKFTPAGAESSFTPRLENPSTLAFDRNGDLFVVDGTAILKFTPGGVHEHRPGRQIDRS